jgi:uncharacterized protein (DUF2235 family)
MKRIVICLDGTWDSARTGPRRTNVAKICDMVAATDKDGVKQVAHYVEGIATHITGTLGFLLGAVGYGVADRIKHAYRELCRDFEPGDEIYIFGFSRGAFEARSLAGFISHFGIAKRDAGRAVKRAWRVYQKAPSPRREARIAKIRQVTHYPVPIACVGVWETVGNIGNPFISSDWLGRRFKFHDLSLSDQIAVGLHALSIDEVRGPFRPTLWTLPAGKALAPGQHIEQVWMPGSHADIGGGCAETELSDIGLTWMAERVTATTKLALDVAHPSPPQPDALGPQHSPTEGPIYYWSGVFPFIRLINQNDAAISRFRRALIGDWRSGKLAPGLVSVNESLHPAAIERFGKEVTELREGASRRIPYRPRNLALAIAAK